MGKKAARLFQQATAAQWRLICDRAGNQCLMCGTPSRGFVKNLVRPKSRQGCNDPENWQPLCTRCAAAKGNRFIDFRSDPPLCYDGDCPCVWTSEDTARLLEVVIESRVPISQPSPWRLIREVVGYRCLLCNAEGPLTRDHIVAKARGGKAGWENQQPLCKRCNNAKGSATLDLRKPEWVNPETGQWRCLEACAAPVAAA